MTTRPPLDPSSRDRRVPAPLGVPGVDEGRPEVPGWARAAAGVASVEGAPERDGRSR